MHFCCSIFIQTEHSVLSPGTSICNVKVGTAKHELLVLVSAPQIFRLKIFTLPETTDQGLNLAS
jgi:hypothetical protein